MAAQVVQVIEGQVVRFSVTFTDESTGDPVDPTKVVFGYQIGRLPSVQVAGGSITHDGTGLYHCDVDTTGLVRDRSQTAMLGEWASSGIGQAVGTTAVTLFPQPITPNFS